METNFIIWLVIAITQICLFSFFLGKISSEKDKKVESDIDIVPIVNYNSKAYWIYDDSLYREESDNITIDIKKAEKVDQLNSGLNPEELFYILEMLKDKK